VILVLAMLAIPVKNWADAAKWLGRLVRGFRHWIGKIQDKIDDLENEIYKDAPIDKLIDDVKIERKEKRGKRK